MTEFDNWCIALKDSRDVLTCTTASDDDYTAALKELCELSERGLQIDLHNNSYIDESLNYKIMCTEYEMMQESPIPVIDISAERNLAQHVRYMAEIRFIYFLEVLHKSIAEATDTSEPQRAEKPLQSFVFTQTDKWKKVIDKAVRDGYLKPCSEGYRRTDKLKKSQLAYILGKLTGYKPRTPTSSYGNAGCSFPNVTLCEMFGETRLDEALRKVYEAKSLKKWRIDLDEILGL